MLARIRGQSKLFSVSLIPIVVEQCCLVPRPTLFFFSLVCVDNNTLKWKSGESREGRSIHHVSDIEWTKGGWGPTISKFKHGRS